MPRKPPKPTRARRTVKVRSYERKWPAKPRKARKKRPARQGELFGKR
jgi:hypothetical protein